MSLVWYECKKEQFMKYWFHSGLMSRALTGNSFTLNPLYILQGIYYIFHSVGRNSTKFFLKTIRNLKLEILCLTSQKYVHWNFSMFFLLLIIESITNNNTSDLESILYPALSCIDCRVSCILPTSWISMLLRLEYLL